MAYFNRTFGEVPKPSAARFGSWDAFLCVVEKDEPADVTNHLVSSEGGSVTVRIATRRDGERFEYVVTDLLRRLPEITAWAVARGSVSLTQGEVRREPAGWVTVRGSQQAADGSWEAVARREAPEQPEAPEVGALEARIAGLDFGDDGEEPKR